MNPPNPHSYQRATWLVGAILLTASVSGFFMGLRQTSSQISMTRPVSLVTRDLDRRAALETNKVPRAVSYWEQNWLKEGPNAAWQDRVSDLVQPPLDLTALTNVTEADRAVALLERAVRRAFDGAPAVVPHPIAQDSSAACLACHGPGLAVKDKVASKISHPPYASCTQCHVPSAGPQIPTVEMTLFEPVAATLSAAADPPLRDSRAGPEAPPAVSHSTLLRDDCLSCHGPRGLFGLRTPHPDRQSCLQCHAPNAELDQYSFGFTPGIPSGENLAASRLRKTEPSSPASRANPSP